VTRLAVVGSHNADLTLLADHLPTPGETVVATSPALVSCGGKGGNQAAAAAAFGAAVTVVGKAGDDQQGRQLLATSPLAVSMEAASSSHPALVPIRERNQAFPAANKITTACPGYLEAVSSRASPEPSAIVASAASRALDDYRGWFVT